MKKIGPTFSAELQAAGLFWLAQSGQFTWGSDGKIVFAESATQSQKNAVAVVYEAHDPEAQVASVVVLPPLQFIERFSDDEQLAVVTAAMSNPSLRLWYDKLMAAQEVVFSDPRLSAGLDALVSAGLITAERKAELLTP
jgi:hypothetical protein